MLQHYAVRISELSRLPRDAVANDRRGATLTAILWFGDMGWETEDNGFDKISKAIVATDLGLELASRGHEIHLITYANPVAMRLIMMTSIRFQIIVRSRDQPALK
jgi:hypothetical protein